MGIKGLRKLINTHAPASVRKLRKDELRGRAVAIDVSIDVYQLYHVGSSRGIVGSTGMGIHHLTGLLSRTAKLIAAETTPVYVFDGPPPAEKRATLDKRKAAVDSRGGVHVPQSAFNDVQRLFQIMGVKYYNAVSEAEAQCAIMCAEDTVYAVVTEDYDVLAFGAPRMIVGDEIITLQDVLTGLGLTQAQFIDLCILLGCDYSGTIPGIGPKRALSLLKKHGSIEAIITALEIKPGPEFAFVPARRELTTPGVTANLPAGDLPTFTEAKNAEICEYLVKSGLAEEKCQKILKLLL